MNEPKEFKHNPSIALGDLHSGEWMRDEQGRVFIRCPHKHGRVGMITGNLCMLQGHPGRQDWAISAEGKVTPSVHFVDPECGYHEFITLLDWKPLP